MENLLTGLARAPGAVWPLSIKRGPMEWLRVDFLEDYEDGHDSIVQPLSCVESASIRPFRIQTPDPWRIAAQNMVCYEAAGRTSDVTDKMFFEEF